MKVDLYEQADGQVKQNDAWLRANRLAAPDLFINENKQLLWCALRGRGTTLEPVGATRVRRNRQSPYTLLRSPTTLRSASRVSTTSLAWVSRRSRGITE